MKKHLLVAAALLALTIVSAPALTVPVAEDTCSSAVDKSIKAASGSATSMMVNAKQTAFIRFDLNDLDVVPSPIQPGNIKSAILRLYVISAKPAADLSVHTVTSAWSEHFAGGTAPAPTIDGLPIANIHAAQLSAKNYVTVEITGAVVDAIQKGNVFGFAIKTASAKVVLASKEGSATGYPAQLDLDANLADSGNGTVSTQNLVLPATTVNAGIIYSGASTLVQAFGTDNFFAGVGAGNLAMDGIANTAIGKHAFFANTSGAYNAAIGYAALGNNTAGSYNTASGTLSLVSNTTGSRNTASGMNALYTNSTGDKNTASGCDALRTNTSGYENSAVGQDSIYSNTTGIQNTASGASSLYSNKTGDANTATGTQALFGNKTGDNNTACGWEALAWNTSGSYNIAIGTQAGYELTTGSANIDIGNAGVGGESNTIRLGTQGTQTAAYIAGISGAMSSGGAAVYVNSIGKLGTITSSMRFKTDIKDMGGSSDVLLALRPVTFRYKPEIDPAGLQQFGLIAEDVEKVCPGLVIRDDKGQIQTVRYEAVNAMLLNEFLKEHKRVGEQEQEIRSLAARVIEMGAQIQQLSQRLDDRDAQPVSPGQ